MGTSSQNPGVWQHSPSYGSDLPPPYARHPSPFEPGRENAGVHDKPRSEGPDDFTPSENLADLQPPPTARYLLGLEDDTAIQRPVGGTVISPASFEFELVCMRCWEYESECTCQSRSGKPTVAIHPSSLSVTKKPYGQLPVPIPLVKRIGMRSAHFASSVAHAVWPVTCLGQVPIFSEDSLSILRSRALERAPDAKTFLKTAYRLVPAAKGAECECGCQETICAQVALHHDLYNKPADLARASSTSYAVEWRPNRSFTAVRLGNGKTYIPSRNQNTTVTEIESAFEEDYLMCCALSCISWTENNYIPTARAEKMTWDGILANLLATVLSRTPNSFLDFRHMPLRRYVNTAVGTRVVLRSENFGVGTGHLIMDLRPGAKLQMGNFTEWNIPVRSSMYSDFLETNDLRSPSIRAGPTQGKSSRATQAAIGYGWSQVKLDASSEYPVLRVTSDAHPTGMNRGLWPPTMSSRAQRCSGLCGSQKAATVDYAGFSPPREQGKETTVYILGRDASPYVVVAQYAQMQERPLYFVHHDACMECTILHAPPGSIVAGPLPKPFLV